MHSIVLRTTGLTIEQSTKITRRNLHERLFEVTNTHLC